MMTIKLSDVLQLPGLSEMTIVAGKRGLERILFCSHIVDTPDASNWVQGGELLFITGIGIQDHLEELQGIVRECCKKNVAGLVINVGPYIAKTPEAVIELADELGFPVFELPWKIKLREVTRVLNNMIALKQIKTNAEHGIVETILYGSDESIENFITQAAAYQFDLNQAYQVMIIEFEQLTEYLQEIMSFSEQQALVVRWQIESTAVSVFEHCKRKVMILFCLDTLMILLPSPHNSKKSFSTIEIADALVRQFKADFSGLGLSIGWGEVYEDIRDARKSLLQAGQALRVAKSIPGSYNCRGFEDLGFYKVLFNVKERKYLESFRNEVLHLLMEYDKKHGAELVNTLAVYLEENGNCDCVSKRLFIHKNTLKYRLKKISEISGKNLFDSQDRALLNFATIVHNFLSI